MSSRRGGGELDAVRTRDLAAPIVTPTFRDPFRELPLESGDPVDGRALAFAALVIVLAFFVFAFGVVFLVRFLVS